MSVQATILYRVFENYQPFSMLLTIDRAVSSSEVGDSTTKRRIEGIAVPISYAVDFRELRSANIYS